MKSKIDNNLNMSICDTIHYGINCKNCQENPIVGYRYKCSECYDYNLCQKCEEENEIKEFHNHDFIKLRKAEKDKNNNLINNNNFNIINNDYKSNNNNYNNFNGIDKDYKNNNYDNLINNYVNENDYQKQINNNNNINNNNYSFDDFELLKKEGEGDYSYQCENTLLLSVYIFEGTDKANIKLNISNNGNKPWTKQTKLIFDNKSAIKGEDIILGPLNPGDKGQYEIAFKDLKYFNSGEYRAYLTFNVNGKNYGDILMVKFIIKKKENPEAKDEFEQYKDKVIEFRDNFGLSKEDYPDQKIFEILKAYNYNFEKAFDSLFN